MALTTQQNGTTVGGLSNQARASWWNDYKDVLTGVMTDQNIVLNYRPGVTNSKQTLVLQGDGFNALFKAYKSDNITQAALLDSNGNLTISGAFTIAGAMSGITTLGTSGNVTVGGTLGVTGATTLSSTLAVSGAATLSSTLAVTGNATIQSGKNVCYANSGITGKFDAAATSPASPTTGDLWLDTSVVL